MDDSLALHPVEAMNAALSGHPCDLVWDDGTARALNVRRWTGDADAADEFLFLERCAGPSLDVGCGAGRIAAALSSRGVPALGLDISAEAVRLAQLRGAVAVQGDVFADAPAGGPWQCAVLADTNVGIGGDPVRLLGRLRHLVRPFGTVLVEVEPPVNGVIRERVRLRVGGRTSEAFAWARVGTDAIGEVATLAGYQECDVYHMNGRCVAVLGRKGV